MDEQLREAALEYHRLAPAGKISVTPTKGLINQRDLALAYSPGVAAACELIVANPWEARNMTSRANLVAVITNGTAVLGLGNIGPLAGKPVMEGKGCLFKKFAGIDVFDIELDENDPDKLVDMIAAMEPTFGGINLEDIKAPECFYIERKLRERMNIPVFHDDQHGTAIIVAAAVLNGLKVVGKDIREVKLAGSGAGAAALACLDLLVAVGMKVENITISDSKGVVYAGRKEDMDPNKARYAQATSARRLADIVEGADIFLGLSAAGVLKPEMIKYMARDPLILALANPEPEIRPELAREVRPDAIIATGRSDYPNQVNNVLCFPFIFRGALDVGATTINEEMKAACVHAIAELAHEEQSDVVATAYGDKQVCFGPEYLIPRPFDPRLIVKIAPAVAKAAMESGVATMPITDFAAYREKLTQFVYQTGMIMRPVFSSAKQAEKRVVYAEGEDARVLRAVQVVIDEGLARPILIGQPDAIAANIEALGLRIRPGTDCELVDPATDSRYEDWYRNYYAQMARKGVSLEVARLALRRSRTLIGAMLIQGGDADAMLCGTSGAYESHLQKVSNVIGMREGVTTLAAMNLLMLPERTVFVCDTYVNPDPDAQQLADMTLLAAEEVRRFGLVPRVALMSHSSFGSADTPSARKMRDALALIRQRAPGLEVEGEMQGDAAMSRELLVQTFPGSRLKGDANLLIMPTLDAANISFNMLKMVAGGGITVGPILLGLARPVHILTPTSSVRRIVNMTALAGVGAAGLKAASGNID
jgi:malate dehydrogenase (oxaloacetate-decarboxylating)(NADP+)